MSTGPWHYAQAERFLETAAEHGYNAEEMDLAAFDMARAQVHATLALAAAVALGIPAGLPSGDWDDWRFIASADHAGRIPGSEREVKP